MRHISVIDWDPQNEAASIAKMTNHIPLRRKSKSLLNVASVGKRASLSDVSVNSSADKKNKNVSTRR